jgi:hypothetical protein
VWAAFFGALATDRRWVRGGCTVAFLAVAGALPAPPGAAGAGLYLGATISGETYEQGGSAPLNQSAWSLFERHAGKKVAVLNTGQSWGIFNGPEMNATRARGAVPLVTMGLGTGITLAEVAAGDQDAAIRGWAQAAKAWGHPFLFNPWWEMNGTWYSWGGDPNFVAAWRHFHDLVVAEGATNVTWTWTTNSLWENPASDPAPYYPGDAYVDWVGIDSYNWGRNPAQPDRWLSPDQTITPTLERVEQIAPGKPIAIVEDASSEIGGNKTDWIEEMLTTYLPHHPDIGAYLWFNWNFPKATARADWPIESSAPAQQAFRKGIQSSFYRSALPPLPDLTKVPPPSAPSTGEGPSALDLSPAGQDAGAPQVAVAADDTATVVWSAGDGSNFAVYERRIGPGGAPGPVKLLSTPSEDAFSPRVAVAPDGTATVVWVGFDGSYFLIYGRRIGADGTLGSIKSLSVTGRDAGEPDLAVAPDGTATVVWKRFDGFHYLIKERRIKPDGAFAEESSHTLSEVHQDATEPAVAVAAGGAAIVAWSRFDASNTVIQAVRIAPGGTPDPSASNLSLAGRDAVQPTVAVGSDGVATVAWSRFDGSDTIVQERQISAAGVVDPAPHDLSAAGQNAAEPDLAVGPNGTVTAVWERYDGGNFVVQERRIAAGVPGASTRNLSASGADASEPKIDAGPSGAATVAWSRFDGNDFVVQRSDLATDGALERGPIAVSAPGRGAHGPDVAVAADGTLTTVWARYNGAKDVVQRSTVPRIGVSLAPAVHDFGSVQLGSDPGSGQAFEIANHGFAPLVISSISIGGADPGQFTLADLGPCTGASIDDGETCQFSAGFDPSIVGHLQAKVEIASNAPSSPDSIPLSGTGFAEQPPMPPPPPVHRDAAVVTPVDNSVQLGRAILNRRAGTAKLPVTVPGPGSLTLAGPVDSTLPVEAAGTEVLTIKPQGGAVRKLQRNGTVKLKIAVTFTPAGGAPNSVTATLRLRKLLHRGRG